MNIGIFTGRLTADATFRNGTEPSKNNARFTVAVTDPWNSEKTDFFTVSCFGKKADYVANGLQKGRFLKGCEIEISGPVRLEKYKTQNGEERCYIGVIAETIYCKVHKDYKAAQNGASSANGIPQYSNNGPSASYNQNGNTPSQQYGGQNATSGRGNQYNGNTPAQQFRTPNGPAGNGAAGYNGQNGNAQAQQYNRNVQNGNNSGQYGGRSDYNSQNANSPAQQFGRQDNQPGNGTGQYSGTSGYAPQSAGQASRPFNGNQGNSAQGYNPETVPQSFDSQYGAENLPYNTLPDSIPAPEFKREQEGGFRPATYHYE